jgi:hypothetical protein
MNFAIRFAVIGKPKDAGAQAVLHWAVDDPQEVINRVPRLKLVTTVSYLTMPEMVDRLAASSRYQKVVGGIMGHAAWYRKAMQHMRFEF